MSLESMLVAQGRVFQVWLLTNIVEFPAYASGRDSRVFRV